MKSRWIGIALAGVALALGLGVRWNRAWRFELWTDIPLPPCASIVEFDAPVQSVLGYSGEGFYYVHLKGTPECIAEFQRSAVTLSCKSLRKTGQACSVHWAAAEDDDGLRSFAPQLIEEVSRGANGERVQSLRNWGIALLASPKTGDVWFFDRQS